MSTVMQINCQFMEVLQQSLTSKLLPIYFLYFRILTVNWFEAPYWEINCLELGQQSKLYWLTQMLFTSIQYSAQYHCIGKYFYIQRSSCFALWLTILQRSSSKILSPHDTTVSVVSFSHMDILVRDVRQGLIHHL